MQLKKDKNNLFKMMVNHEYKKMPFGNIIVFKRHFPARESKMILVYKMVYSDFPKDIEMFVIQI